MQNDRFLEPIFQSVSDRNTTLQSTSLSNRQKRAWIGLSVVAWGIVVLIVLPPYVGLGGRAILMSAFQPLCHQIAERSPTIDGVQLAVCHRCFGIYAGLAVSASLLAGLIGFARPLEPYARILLPASLMPLTIDWAGDVLGVWTNTPESRMFTGAVFGVVGGVYLARAVVDIATARKGDPLDAVKPSGT